MSATPRDPATSPQSAPLSDSAWFWIACFSLMALGALLAIDGRYVRRQAQVEIRYLAQQGPLPSSDNSGEPAGRAESVDPSPNEFLPATADPLRVPLGPIRWLLAAVFVLSMAILLLSRRGNRGVAR